MFRFVSNFFTYATVIAVRTTSSGNEWNPPLAPQGAGGDPHTVPNCPTRESCVSPASPRRIDANGVLPIDDRTDRSHAQANARAKWCARFVKGSVRVTTQARNVDAGRQPPGRLFPERVLPRPVLSDGRLAIIGGEYNFTRQLPSFSSRFGRDLRSVKNTGRRWAIRRLEFIGDSASSVLPMAASSSAKNSPSTTGRFIRRR